MQTYFHASLANSVSVFMASVSVKYNLTVNLWLFVFFNHFSVLPTHKNNHTFACFAGRM